MSPNQSLWTIVVQFLLIIPIHAQEIQEAVPLFQEEEPLLLKLRYSIKEARNKTNDSTYLDSYLWYKEEDKWDSIKIKLRARGNFRRSYCNHVPIKIKFKKSAVKKTLFEGNKKLKVVLPCRDLPNANDYVLKEYLAYQLYEIASDVHFKTRMLVIEFYDEKKRKSKYYSLLGIFIEDVDLMAKRLGGEEVEKKVHPLNQHALSSIRSCFFQFMIGNTDFSARSQHNNKLMYADNKISYVPYDFDMSGLVNARYATISGMENIETEIRDVTERVYKGYKRDREMMEQVRNEFLDKEDEFLDTIDQWKERFDNQDHYTEAREFLVEFFEILKSDKAFKREILDQMRK